MEEVKIFSSPECRGRATEKNREREEIFVALLGLLARPARRRYLIVDGRGPARNMADFVTRRSGAVASIDFYLDFFRHVEVQCIYFYSKYSDPFRK